MDFMSLFETIFHCSSQFFMNGYYISNRKSPGQMGFDLNPEQQQQQKRQQQQLFVSK